MNLQSYLPVELHFWPPLELVAGSFSGDSSPSYYPCSIGRFTSVP